MSILKNKILMAQKRKKQTLHQNINEVPENHEKSLSHKYSTMARCSISGQNVNKEKKGKSSPVSEKTKSTKNIAKNYGSAIASFACSDLCKPYIKPLLRQEHITSNTFQKFAQHAKKSILGIDSFRNTLLIKTEDSEESAACKRIFQKIAEIFIKYFSVNWIFTAKIMHKLVYLKYRYKILRRVQNPEFFTYMKA